MLYISLVAIVIIMLSIIQVVYNLHSVQVHLELIIMDWYTIML